MIQQAGITGGGGGSVTLTASELHIGEVGGRMACPSSNFNRPGGTVTYTVGYLIANNATAGSVTPLSWTFTRVAQGSSYLIRARLVKSTTTLSGIFRVHFYTASPTCSNGDNGAWLTNSASSYLGNVDISITQAFTDGAFGVGVSNVGSTIAQALASGSTVYGLIEARSAYAAGAAENFAVTLELSEN